MEFFYDLMRTETLPIVFVFMFFAATIEYFFPPFPGDTVLLFGAFLTGRGILPIPAVFISVTLGSFIGSLCIYAFGATKGRKYFLKKNFAFFSPSKVRSLESFFRRRGGAVIILNRFAPGFRSFFFVAAGMAKMPLLKVSIYSLLSILIWNTCITYIGNRLGYRWEELRGLLELYSRAAIAILSGLILLYIIYQIALKIKEKKNDIMETRKRGHKDGI